MKPSVISPPILALVIASIGLGIQRKSISTLEQEVTILQNEIAARSSDTSPDSPRDKRPSPDKLAKDKQPIDWKKVTGAQQTNHMRTMMQLRKRLQAMSNEELITALEEIGALDLPAESREYLEEALFDTLAEKDLELALNQFVNRIEDERGSMSWALTSGMQEWVKKDPAAAIAWFDRQIADGKFDSKSLERRSQSRLHFEGSFIGVLLSSDPEAAGSRLAALPEDQRDDALFQYSYPLKREDQRAFAKLVREQIPEYDRARTLSEQASRMVGDDGYLKVTEFLERIQATPAERSACVEKAAESTIEMISSKKKVTREDLDTLREWVTSQGPEKTGAVTGKVLASATQNGRKLEFSEAAELAVQYNNASGNDEVLYSFLKSWPAQENKEQARALAEKISDVKRREEILKNLE